MRTLLLLLMLPVLMLTVVSNLVAQGTAINVMPLPAGVEVSPGVLKLNDTFSIATAEYTDPRLESAIHRLQRRMANRTGITVPVGVALGFPAPALTITVREGSPAVPKLGEDESYTLTIDPQHATLTANTVTGALRGLETLLQLISGSPEGYFLPAVTIQDKPRFPWRGLMIDVGRHFQPVEVIRRNLDAMAAVKMNVFHWHLSDDQGFRIESKVYPRLHQMGSDGQYYTQDEVRAIIAYAAERGIRVLPEFDMPGHTNSWMVGYPDLASAPGPYQVERQWGVFDATMDPTREETYQFLDAFIGEMAALFPDEYFHIGGDENNGKQWKANPAIQEFMQQRGFHTTAELQTYFNQRMMKILQKHGKKMVGWDEILHRDLPKDAVVQAWRGYKLLDESARGGWGALWSTYYYLDHMGPAEYHYLSDPQPDDNNLSPSEQARVLGGEVCAWAEFLSPENIDSRLWPRTAAVAERFWSPRTVRNVADMYRRLDHVTVWLEQNGTLQLSSTNKMLRQVAGTAEPSPLEMLGRISSPEGVAAREHWGRTHLSNNSFTPLVRLTDAVAPDPVFRRQFAAEVDQLLSDAPRFAAESAELTRNFEQWRDMGPGFAAIAAQAPVVNDASGRVMLLEKLGATGLEALRYLREGKSAPASWKENALALVRAAQTPDQSLLKLPWLNSYRELVLAAAHAGDVKHTSPAQWKRKVLDEAKPLEPKERYSW